MRGVVYRGRATGWLAIAASSSLILRMVDRWWIGLNPGGDVLIALVVAAETAIAALIIGWLLGGLPKWLRPVESGEADLQR